MKKKLIVGNWKLNPATLAEAKHIFSRIKKTGTRKSNVAVVICPPFLYLADLARAALRSAVSLGVQDIFYEEEGSFTGEVSASMVKNLGASYAIVGHSERRRLGESEATVSKKVVAGIKAGLSVVLCIGEDTRDEHGVYLATLRGQLLGALSRISPKFLSHLIVAYEPIWAIGKSGNGAITSRHLHEMVLYIRKILSDEYGGSIARGVRIIYGGSVFPNNAGTFLSEGEADGLLVGRESLKPEDFATIVQSAHDA